MYAVELQQFSRKKHPDIDTLCFLSKNLFNTVNYMFRQRFFENRERSFIKEKALPMPKAKDLMRQAAAENWSDFRALPANTAQKVIKQVAQCWTSYFAAVRDYRAHPEKYKAAPSIPRYKKKSEGRNMVTFSGSTVRCKEGRIVFPEKAGISSVSTRADNVCEVRIVPDGSIYRIEIVYKKEANDANLSKDRALGIDLGVTNLVTMVDNTGEYQPTVIKGGYVKSLNQFYNKERARLQSQLPEKKYRTKRLEQITLKRNNQMHNFMHKTATYIILWCLEHNVGTIVIGKNPEWKQNTNLGKKNNQKFVSIPFNSLIAKITYKAELRGITVTLQEESYTSKCDALQREAVQQHSVYSGKRIHRGLFRSGDGKLLHADVNGALNILRKAIGDHNVVIDWGRLSRPEKICPARDRSSRTPLL